MANVIFKIGTWEQYKALAVKDSNTLYWLEDVLELRKGEELYGVGREASEMAAGLMSVADKIKLDRLEAGNADYAIERQTVAEEGYAASYKLRKTVGETISYVGDTINIPRDMVLSSASLETVVIVDQPYVGAQIGDPYFDLVFNDSTASHIYVPVKGLVDTYQAGAGIGITNNRIDIQIDATNANGLVAIEGAGLGLALATPTSAGAMSAVDKATLDSIPEVYATKDELSVEEEKVLAITEHVEYEISHKPEGTLVDYRDKELRVMCPETTKWEHQQSGENADANLYYIGFKAYAPESAVSFKEDLAEIIADPTMYSFENNEFAGVDEYGRKYSIVWLPVASYDEATGTWIYYGANSTPAKRIGWHYSVEWYDANGALIDADTIRINLTNDDCHLQAEPYYVEEGLNEVRSAVSELEQSYTWGTI